MADLHRANSDQRDAIAPGVSIAWRSAPPSAAGFARRITATPHAMAKRADLPMSLRVIPVERLVIVFDVYNGSLPEPAIVVSLPCESRVGAEVHSRV